MKSRNTIFLLLLFIFLSNIVFAKAPQKNKKASELNDVDRKTMNVFMKQIEIYGRIAKPQTVFIIPGSDPRVDGIRIERRFFRDISHRRLPLLHLIGKRCGQGLVRHYSSLRMFKAHFAWIISGFGARGKENRKSTNAPHPRDAGRCPAILISHLLTGEH